MDTPTLKRTIKLGTVGSDALACKRALARAGYGPDRLRVLTPVFGPFAVQNLEHWQRHEKLAATGRIDSQGELDKLWPWFDALARVEYAAWKATPQQLYVDPFHLCTGLVPQRTDQGVDYGADAGSPIVAIGKMLITRATTDSGWPGPYGSPSGFNGRGGCIQGKLLEGPHAGEEVYLAEYIRLHVKVNQVVPAGALIASFYHSAASLVGIEFGWVRRGTSEPCSSDTSGTPTPGGINMTRWIEQLGGATQQHFGAGSTFCPC